jgi:hypothetical protein
MESTFLFLFYFFNIFGTSYILFICFWYFFIHYVFLVFFYSLCKPLWVLLLRIRACVDLFYSHGGVSDLFLQCLETR